jgi:S1-C subfamily serine protease
MNAFSPDPSERPRPSFGLTPVLFLLVVFVLATYGALQLLGLGASPLFDSAAQSREVVARGDLAQDERTTIDLFREVSPTVVHIASSAERRRAWYLDPTVIPQGSGSGFTWDDQGYVVTNYHVIRGGTRWGVTLADGSKYEARLVGYVARYDLAVLKIDAPTRNLRPIRVGSSRELLVGQKVFAVGNPFGLDHTLTTGVISGLGRRITSISGDVIEGVIQTDAAINFGNSGGPLFDSAARLIGVNTAIVGTEQGGQGIGFAVPVDIVNQVVPMIIGGGASAAEALPTRAGLGVIIAPESFTQLQGLEGVVVEDVLDGSAAEKAGLLPMRSARDGSYRVDVIKSLDGAPIRTNHDLLMALKGREPGERAVIVFEREGVERRVELTLDALGAR